MAITKINYNALGLVRALWRNYKENDNAPISLAQLADMASVEPKSGYLSAVKKMVKLETVKDGAEIFVTTTYTYRTKCGVYTREEEKTSAVTGYRLAADTDLDAIEKLLSPQTDDTAEGA